MAQTSGALGWWYNLSLPSRQTHTTEEADTAPKVRERLRYAHLTSGFLLLFILIDIPAGSLMFFDSPPGSTAPFIAMISATILVLAFIFCKFGQQIVTATLILAFVQFTILGDLTTNPLDPSLFQIIYALLFTVILAGAIMPPVASLIVGVLNCIYILLIVEFVPHTANWTAMLQQGLYSILIFLPLCMQIGVAIICFVILRNLNLTLRRAYRAEEIVALQEAIAENEESLNTQQKQLEEALKRIADVHARVANGDLSARVPLAEGDVLWSVAVPLNHLLNRLQIAQHAQDTYANVQQIAQSTAEQLNNIVKTRQIKLLPISGTMLDPVILAINQLLQSLQRPSSPTQQK